MSPERPEPGGDGMASVRQISCGRCGAVIKPGKKFCSQCGSPAVAVPSAPPPRRARRPNICPECSFENHHSDLFCKGCGAQLADSSVGFQGGDSDRDTPAAPPLEDVVKTDANVPPVASREPADVETDVVAPPAMQAASAPPPEESDEMAEAHAAGSAVARNEPPDSGSFDLERLDLRSEAAAPSLTTSGAPSQGPEEESPAIQRSANPEVARPRRPSPRAVGVAVGVGLAALIPLVHFHRPAKAQGKQFSTATTALVAPSPSRASPVARIDSANQVLPSADFNPAGEHGQSRRNPVRLSGARSQKSLKDALRASSREADLHQMTATASAPALTTAHDLQPALPPRPTLATDHSESQNGVPSASVSAQNPVNLAQVSRQIPAALPSTMPARMPANLPPETNPGSVSTEGSAAPAHSAETVQAVQPAKLLSHPALRYPPLALKSGIEGDVHLEAQVRADGSIGNVRVVYGNSILSDAAVDLVQNSRYQPALVDGRPARSSVDVVISFRLPR